MPVNIFLFKIHIYYIKRSIVFRLHISSTMFTAPSWWYLFWCKQFSWPCSLYDFTYKGADKSLARPTSRCILFDG